jgi:ribonuclease Z
VVYCTDTRFCPAAIELAAGADLLIHEATYGDELAGEAAERFHCTAREAARVAHEAKASRLLLTHFSPRYLDLQPLVAQAREVFAETEAAVELTGVVVR